MSTTLADLPFWQMVTYGYQPMDDSLAVKCIQIYMLLSDRPTLMKINDAATPSYFPYRAWLHFDSGVREVTGMMRGD